MRKVLWLITGLCLAAAWASSLHPAPVEGATVKLTTDDTVLEITLENGTKLVVTSKGTKLPPGTYFIKSLRLLKRDPKNQVWEMHSDGTLSTLKSLTVSPGQEKVLDTGGKIHFDYFIWPRGKDGELRVLFRVTAQGGYAEVYYPGAFLGRKTPPMPAYRITDENGKTLASGRLKHEAAGCGTYDWIVPKGLTGNFRVEIKPDMGPFEWEPESKGFTLAEKEAK